MYPHLFVSAQRDGGTPPEKSASPPPFAPANAPPQGGETVAGRGLLSNLDCRRSGRQQIFNIPRRHDLLRSATHPQPPRRGSRSRLDMTARRCDLSCENLCEAAGAAVRSSAPSSVLLASCETHFARRCLASPPDERSLRSAASGGRSEQGTAPRSKISRRMPQKFSGTAR